MVPSLKQVESLISFVTKNNKGIGWIDIETGRLPYRYGKINPKSLTANGSYFNLTYINNEDSNHINLFENSVYGIAIEGMGYVPISQWSFLNGPAFKIECEEDFYTWLAGDRNV